MTDRPEITRTTEHPEKGDDAPPRVDPRVDPSERLRIPFQGDRKFASIEELRKAVEILQRGDHDAALGLLRSATEKHPDLPPARLMLAQLLLEGDQRVKGRAELEQAAIENPDYPGIYLAFSVIALRESRLTDAQLHLDRAAATAQSDTWSESQKRNFQVYQHAGAAGIAERRKDWNAAQASLTAWLKLEPANGAARYRLARCLFRRDQPPLAAAELEQAKRDDPTLPSVFMALAQLHTEAGDLEGAAKRVRQAIENAPRDPQASLEAANWFWRHDQPREAKSHAAAAAELGADPRAVNLLRGLIARHLKEYGQAEGYLEVLSRQSPQNFQVSNQLALALVEQADASKRERALQLAEANVRLYPASAEAQSTLGWTYYRSGRLDDAERALRRSVSSGSASPETAYYLAQVMSDRGQRDGAERLLRAAVSAQGAFAFRKEAQDWIERISLKPP